MASASVRRSLSLAFAARAAASRVRVCSASRRASSSASVAASSSRALLGQLAAQLLDRGGFGQARLFRLGQPGVERLGPLQCGDAQRRDLAPRLLLLVQRGLQLLDPGQRRRAQRLDLAAPAREVLGLGRDLVAIGRGARGRFLQRRLVLGQFRDQRQRRRRILGQSGAGGVERLGPALQRRDPLRLCGLVVAQLRQQRQRRGALGVEPGLLGAQPLGGGGELIEPLVLRGAGRGQGADAVLGRGLFALQRGDGRTAILGLGAQLGQPCRLGLRRAFQVGDPRRAALGGLGQRGDPLGLFRDPGAQGIDTLFQFGVARLGLGIAGLKLGDPGIERGETFLARIACLHQPGDALHGAALLRLQRADTVGLRRRARLEIGDQRLQPGTLLGQAVAGGAGLGQPLLQRRLVGAERGGQRLGLARACVQRRDPVLARLDPAAQIGDQRLQRRAPGRRQLGRLGAVGDLGLGALQPACGLGARVLGLGQPRLGPAQRPLGLGQRARRRVAGVAHLAQRGAEPARPRLGRDPGAFGRGQLALEAQDAARLRVALLAQTGERGAQRLDLPRLRGRFLAQPAEGGAHLRQLGAAVCQIGAGVGQRRLRRLGPPALHRQHIAEIGDLRHQPVEPAFLFLDHLRLRRDLGLPTLQFSVLPGDLLAQAELHDHEDRQHEHQDQQQRRQRIDEAGPDIGREPDPAAPRQRHQPTPSPPRVRASIRSISARNSVRSAAVAS